MEATKQKRSEIKKPTVAEMNRMFDGIIAALSKGDDVRITSDRDKNIVMHEIKVSRIKI